MIEASLSQISEAVDGTIIGGDFPFTGVSIDTRTIEVNNIYCAIVGEKFDGHNFIEEALVKGAAAVIVSNDIIVDVPMIKVADTTKALAKLAKWWLEKCNTKVVAITGSVGKTTVKNLTNSIFNYSSISYLSSAKNYNNEYGLPLTIFKLEPKHEYIILEMGAAKKDDIRYLCNIAKPYISVITAIAPMHIERFGSLKNIVVTKAQIYSDALPSGVAVFNSNEKNYKYFQDVAVAGNSITYGEVGSDVRAEKVVNAAYGLDFVLHTPLGSRKIELPLLGMHNVANALAATSIAVAACISLDAIEQGLCKSKAVAGRLEVESIDGCRIINDTYNAGPASVNAAIDVLSQFDTRKILVLGDMLELGKSEKSIHVEIGEYARNKGIDYLFSIGKHASYTLKGYGLKNSKEFLNKDSLVRELFELISSDKIKTTVLVKGSRGAKMEDIVSKLKENLKLHKKELSNSKTEKEDV